ncbi:hypothetical protein BH09MYX1_BH09MYX1_57500 [soil metagenome]
MEDVVPKPFVRSPRKHLAGFAGAGVLLVAMFAYVIGRVTAAPVALLPPPTTTTITVASSPNVLVAVRDLKRLETESYHFERVVDMTRTESHLYGVIEAKDRLLLVAAGDVSAGVDLSELRESDVTVNWEARSVKITLPAAQIFHSEIDEEKTHVHERTTDLIAHRDEKLEGDARALAQQEMTKAAKDAHILDRAGDAAKRTVEQLLKSLGFTSVVVDVKS